MNPLWALVFVIVGIVLAFIQNKWQEYTFWMLLGIAAALVLPHISAL